jgi:hypothetical protein
MFTEKRARRASRALVMRETLGVTAVPMDDSTPTDPRTLAGAYLRHHATGADADSWAYDEVNRRVGRRGDAQDGWRVVLALLDVATGQEVGYVGAGPLEDLVVNWGAALAGRIEARARRDGKFRFALQRVWLRKGDLPEPILRRVVAASDGVIDPLPPAPQHRTGKGDARKR